MPMSQQDDPSSKVLNFDLSYYECLPKQHSAAALINFRKNFNGDCFATKHKYTVNETFETLILLIKEGLVNFGIVNPRINCFDPHTAIINNEEVFISLEDRNDDRNYSHNDLWTQYNRNINIDCYGPNHVLQKISEYLINNIVVSKIPTITWDFLSDGCRQSQNIKIAPAKKIYDSFYPWIEGGVYEYFDRYLASESSILVLLGEPGTAKTSFIRSLIWHSSLNTTFTYDEDLLKSDSFFVDFLINDDKQLLIVEDADALLGSRESEGNKIMSKFLNVGDGLASIGHKKMIFTANIRDASKIDTALLRPGRCFDCKEFRRLTMDETVKAAEAAGIPIPAKKSEGYTLAELFAIVNKEERDIIVNKVGFVGPPIRRGRGIEIPTNRGSF